MLRIVAASVYLLTFTLSHSLLAVDIKSLTSEINAIGEGGKGYPAAVKAMESLSKAEPSEIPEILRQIQDDHPVAANWLRGAVESIAEKSRDSGNPLPESTYIDFIAETSNGAKARTIAFHLLKVQDEEAAEKLIPNFENDASLELRLKAVNRLMDQAKKAFEEKNEDEARKLYLKAIGVARNANQVETIAKALKDLGEDIDVGKQMGFLKNWYVIAPFDFDGGNGFEEAYPPEQSINLAGVYTGKAVEELEGPVTWKEVELPQGKKQIDFNKAFAPVKEVVGYAYTQFNSGKDQAVDLRWSSPNATRVWVNGELVASNHVYHAGSSFDQYTTRANLIEGKNDILVKVVQNEQT